MSAESAACVVDGYAAAGVSAEEMLAVIVEDQAPTDTEAFAAGSASIDECLSPEEQQALDSGVAEQDPEALRADYISALITITDLNEQQAGCVVDAISDAGFDLDE